MIVASLVSIVVLAADAVWPEWLSVDSIRDVTTKRTSLAPQYAGVTKWSVIEVTSFSSWRLMVMNSGEENLFVDGEPCRLTSQKDRTFCIVPRIANDARLWGPEFWRYDKTQQTLVLARERARGGGLDHPLAHVPRQPAMTFDAPDVMLNWFDRQP